MSIVGSRRVWFLVNCNVTPAGSARADKIVLSSCDLKVRGTEVERRGLGGCGWMWGLGSDLLLGCGVEERGDLVG